MKPAATNECSHTARSRGLYARVFRVCTHVLRRINHMKPVYLFFFVVPLAIVQQRFDMLVREDFFAGMSGDSARFEKAMKFTEETLSKDPNHAEAKVWHGSGVFFRAGQFFIKGAFIQGVMTCDRGI